MDELNELTLDDLLIISSGRDDNGLPKSAVSMLLLTTDTAGKEIVSEKNIHMSKSVSFFYISSGAAVMELICDRNSPEQSQNAAKILQQWITNKDSDDYRAVNQLHVTVSPFLYEGRVIVDLKELVYTQLFVKSKELHFILVFDISEDYSVELITGESVNIKELEDEAQKAIDAELAEMNAEYEALAKEVAELETKVNLGG